MVLLIVIIAIAILAVIGLVVAGFFLRLGFFGGCISILVFYLLVLGVWYVWKAGEGVINHLIVMRSERINEAELAEAAKSTEAAKSVQLKARAQIDVELQNFMVEEVPSIKECLDKLRAESAVHRDRMASLKKSLIDFGKDPASDADFNQLTGYGDKLQTDLQNVSNRLHEAFIAYVKYKAFPNRQGLAEVKERIFLEGQRYALEVGERYERMKGN